MEARKRVGEFGKPHGVKGEITALIHDNGYEPEPDRFIFVDIDGLQVPFRILEVRTKGAESFLLTLRGITSDRQAAGLSLKQIWAPEKDIEPSDETNFYLEDLVGFKLKANGKEIGVIENFDDSTENYLITVARHVGDTVIVPLAEDLIDEIDTDTQVIYMTLPEGIFDL